MPSRFTRRLLAIHIAAACGLLAVPARARLRFGPRVLLLGLLAVLQMSAAHGGLLFFSENFDATTVTNNLSVPTGWTFGTDSTPNGVAQNNASQRTYISTAATNYNTVDFTYEITFSVRGGAYGIAFFGIGSGQPNPDFYDEPYGAFFLRQAPSSFARGETSWTISTPTDPENPSENIFLYSGGGDGTYRAQLLKSGSSLTLGIDGNYTGGPFAADFTITKSLADLSFLDATNSRLFFGTGDSATTFDNLSITAPVPEIDPAGMGSVLALVAGAVGLMERHRKRA